MAQIPFTDRELYRAWKELYAASQDTGNKKNPYRLLLIYSVECGLKAIWLKRKGKTLFDASDISKTGHDLNKIIKELYISSVQLTPTFDLSEVTDHLQNKKIQRKNNRIDALHQAWRYGGKLSALPVDDKTMEEQLENIQQFISKELRS